LPATLILILALLAGGATLAGGALALRLRDRLHLILGFSAGAVLAAAFFDLLPEALRISPPPSDPSTGIAIAALGFFAYTVLDRLIFLHAHHDHGTQTQSAAAGRQWSGAASLSLHSLMDGFAIGVAFRASPAAGIVVAAAVLAHDCSDGMNTVGIVLRHGGVKRDAYRWLFVDAVAPLIGATISLFVAPPAAAMSVMLALFAGFFLYIGASDLLPESVHEHPKFLTTLMTLLGAGLLYIVVRLAA
jgi:ZIP family zinc transporter